jgi:uncharacterized damage-inducible protein DinB
MRPEDALLDSWTRQCRALDNLCRRFDGELLGAKPAEDGWTAAEHLCHTHGVRRYWLEKASGRQWPLKSLFTERGGEYEPSADLAEIRRNLAESEAAVRDWVAEALASGETDAGHYDHPVLFLQHMIWHEGYHFGLLMLALRRAGAEPPEEWEDRNVWDLWRQPD